MASVPPQDVPEETQQIVHHTDESIPAENAKDNQEERDESGYRPLAIPDIANIPPEDHAAYRFGIAVNNTSMLSSAWKKILLEDTYLVYDSPEVRVLGEPGSDEREASVEELRKKAKKNVKAADDMTKLLYISQSAIHQVKQLQSMPETQDAGSKDKLTKMSEWLRLLHHEIVAARLGVVYIVHVIAEKVGVKAEELVREHVPVEEALQVEKDRSAGGERVEMPKKADDPAKTPVPEKELAELMVHIGKAAMGSVNRQVPAAAAAAQQE